MSMSMMAMMKAAPAQRQSHRRAHYLGANSKPSESSPSPGVTAGAASSPRWNNANTANPRSPVARRPEPTYCDVEPSFGTSASLTTLNNNDHHNNGSSIRSLQSHSTMETDSVGSSYSASSRSIVNRASGAVSTARFPTASSFGWSTPNNERGGPGSSSTFLGSSMAAKGFHSALPLLRRQRSHKSASSQKTVKRSNCSKDNMNSDPLSVAAIDDSSTITPSAPNDNQSVTSSGVWSSSTVSVISGASSVSMGSSTTRSSVGDCCSVSTLSSMGSSVPRMNPAVRNKSAVTSTARLPTNLVNSAPMLLPNSATSVSNHSTRSANMSLASTSSLMAPQPMDVDDDMEKFSRGGIESKRRRGGTAMAAYMRATMSTSGSDNGQPVSRALPPRPPHNHHGPSNNINTVVTASIPEETSVLTPFPEETVVLLPSLAAVSEPIPFIATSQTAQINPTPPTTPTTLAAETNKSESNLAVAAPASLPTKSSSDPSGTNLEPTALPGPSSVSYRDPSQNITSSPKNITTKGTAAVAPVSADQNHYSTEHHYGQPTTTVMPSFELTTAALTNDPASMMNDPTMPVGIAFPWPTNQGNSASLPPIVTPVVTSSEPSTARAKPRKQLWGWIGQTLCLASKHHHHHHQRQQASHGKGPAAANR